MKAKVGTILEEDVVKKLKERAFQENRSISDVIQEALWSYFHASSSKRDLRVGAVDRLCTRPFHLTKSELNEIIEEDYYEQ
jgi:hypothetical protein